MKYKKLPIDGYKVLNMYPVYTIDLYDGHEPLKIVGIREGQVELEGDFSGGTHNVSQKQWFNDEGVFVVRTVCDQESLPNGCQVPNVNCCGGGSVLSKHVVHWDEEKEVEEEKVDHPTTLIYPTDEEIASMAKRYVKPLKVSELIKSATMFGYQEGLHRMLELWKEQTLNTDEPIVDEPYITKLKISVEREWNTNFNQDAICECGHSYYRHFDTYEDMDNVGCKYCSCNDFKEKK